MFLSEPMSFRLGHLPIPNLHISHHLHIISHPVIVVPSFFGSFSSAATLRNFEPKEFSAAVVGSWLVSKGFRDDNGEGYMQFNIYWLQKNMLKMKIMIPKKRGQCKVKTRQEGYDMNPSFDPQAFRFFFFDAYFFSKGNLNGSESFK